MSGWSQGRGPMNGHQGPHAEEPGRESADTLLYRYTVRTDRDGNKAIERAARACGVSPTTYVQQHFETIFRARDAGARPAPAADESEDETAVPPTQPADARPLSPSANVLLKAMRAAAEPDGTLSLTYSALGRRCGCSAGAVCGQMKVLTNQRFVSIKKRGSGMEPSVYRVLDMGARA